ncbi:MAG: hypothetical protein IT497_02885 [Ottowia sp.]|nr:hypothetical protein [Ottowia sp.]
MTIKLDKVEHFYGWTAIFVFVVGCLVQDGRFIPIAFFIALILIMLMQARKSKRQEDLKTAYMTAYIKNRSATTCDIHMAGTASVAMNPNIKHKNILDKIEPFCGRIALLIFAVGLCCLLTVEYFKDFFINEDFGVQIFSVTTSVAFLFGLFFQERIRRKQEALSNAYRSVCAENRSIAMCGVDMDMTDTHMVSATEAAFSSSDDSYLTSAHYGHMSMDDYSPAWESTDSTSNTCNIDGSPMCGFTDINGNPYGVT